MDVLLGMAGSENCAMRATNGIQHLLPSLLGRAHAFLADVCICAHVPLPPPDGTLVSHRHALRALHRVYDATSLRDGEMGPNELVSGASPPADNMHPGEAVEISSYRPGQLN